MQLDPVRCLDVGNKGLSVQEQNQQRSLPYLVRSGPLLRQLGSLLQKRRWKLRAVARSGATHGKHPYSKCNHGILQQFPHFSTKPEPENHDIISETEH
jgi:hypothetical protein